MSRDEAPIWTKPEKDKQFWDGEIFIVAVWVNKANRAGYEYYTILASCDSETPVFFVHDGTYKPFDEWDWDDVDWYISINHKEVAGEK